MEKSIRSFLLSASYELNVGTTWVLTKTIKNRTRFGYLRRLRCSFPEGGGNKGIQFIHTNFQEENEDDRLAEGLTF